ncbi:MAG: putative MPP superfamily phosphohydrolase [Halieaceae bacterium]|jgi:predicted MPP superfamily phosphohydrolase
MRSKSLSFIPILLFISVLFLVDLYVFKGLKVLLADMQNTLLKKSILIGHWVLFVVVALWIFLVIYNATANPEFKNYKATYYLVGLSMLIYSPKILFSVFIFSDDIILLFRNIIGYFMPSNIESSGENVSRLKFIYQLGIGAATIPFIGAAYGMIKGRYDFGVKNIPVTLPNLPPSFEGLTMVQLSDLHLGSFFDDKDPVAKAFQMVKDLDPDILVVTGDWVNNFSSEAEGWIEEFKSLPAKMAKLAIVGNHDYGDYSTWESEEKKQANFARLIEIQGEMGFKTLLNDNHIFEQNGEKLAIVGVENWGVKPFPQHGNLDKAKIGTEGVPVKILLSHDPSHFEEVVTKGHPDIDLTLSGHTHGAQFGVELGNIKWSPVQYKYPRWAGMYEVAHQKLYVNRGFGYLAFPGRIGMPPEITNFTFTRG